MSQLHPIFAMALEPFAPLLNKNGTAASPAMAQLFNVAYTAPAKKPRKSTESFSYSLCGVQLECELNFQEAERQTYDESGSPANAQLCEAFCGDTDIIELLSDEQKEEIEIAYLETDRSDV